MQSVELMRMEGKLQNGRIDKILTAVEKDGENVHGLARRESMTAEERKASSSKAARARWGPKQAAKEEKAKKGENG